MVMDGPAERKTWTHDTPDGSGTGIHKKRGSNGWPSIIMNTVIQAQDKKSPLMTMTGPRLAHLNMGPETNCFGTEEVHTQTSYNDGGLIRRPLSGLDLSSNRQRNRLIPSHTEDDVIQF